MVRREVVERARNSLSAGERGLKIVGEGWEEAMIFDTIEETQTSANPAKLFRTIQACSADTYRKLTVGFDRSTEA